jgi:uncharacterized tellurite resistance protein B-like protein
MLKALTDFFEGLGTQTDATDVSEHELQVATALLLIEIARADHSFDAQERASITALLQAHFTLSNAEVDALLKLAENEADDTAHLQGFTRRLHEELDYDGKLRIVEMLWQVALADDELSKFEDSLVRKLGDLLYVSHKDQIRLRNAVMDRP